MKNHRRGRERGQELVEYAIILPIFLLILMSILDLGRAVYCYSAIQNSAREGARYGVIHPEDVAGIEAVVQRKAVGLNPAAMTVTVVLPDEDTIRVAVSFQFRAVTPIIGALLGANEITLASQSTMRIEG
ncbi:MAG: pilus assembly protein [Anaerolineales bacterium]|nr:pilus assembly protein [Anaerolineales bacterium]